jgi:hypothetical protein
MTFIDVLAVALIASFVHPGWGLCVLSLAGCIYLRRAM